MTEKAFEIYEHALVEQHTRNEARRIRTRVAEARGKPHAASMRWPFELLQNALDAGPRDGKDSVSIRVARRADRIEFEHDGAAFTSTELAALLSGGSSKEFESDVTTGRFGTGFLVTHVLAEKVHIGGLLDVDGRLERFDLSLDRGGDEESILADIHSCKDAIKSATQVELTDEMASAQFVYKITSDSALAPGLAALEQSLPYLFGTRPTLSCVRLERDTGCYESWRAGPVSRERTADGFVSLRSISVESEDGPTSEMQICRFSMHDKAEAAALVLIEKTAGGWQVKRLDSSAPRIYREYPVRGSSFVPINLVLDGKFEPDQERNVLLMGEPDKVLLRNAFDAAAMAVGHAFRQGWQNAHVLASARRPSTTFDPSDVGECNWWLQQLRSFAESLSRLPIVHCGDRYLPAVSDDAFADFVIPMLSDAAAKWETTIERMWPVVASATNLLPPRREVAEAWTNICEGWHELGLKLGRITLTELADYVRDDVSSLDELHVTQNPREWLASFLALVGECWRARGGVDTSVLNGLLPNQNRRLCSPAELRVDRGIPEELKAVALEIGVDVRERLFLSEIEEMSQRPNCEHLSYAISESMSAGLGEKDVVELLASELDDQLPEDEECDEETIKVQRASVSLLKYLWDSQGQAAESIARQLPLITAKGWAVRWSHERMMMAPVGTWRASAQAFSEAYPGNRVLSEMYGSCDRGRELGVVAALEAWGVAIRDPLYFDEPTELKDRRLAAIAVEDTSGVTVSGARFSQIALLHPEVLNHCKVGIDEAKALLGLVLCHVAPNDPSWRELREVPGRRAREDIEVLVRPALWLADLRFMSWVPSVEEEGKAPVPRPASAVTLEQLLDPAWLENNDAAIELLSQSFGFDALELRLLGVAPDASVRGELRDGLARLVELGGANNAFYDHLAQEVEEQKKRSSEVDRCRQMGLAVQGAIKEAIEEHGLNLELVDRGFDYEITCPVNDIVEDIAFTFDVGSYLLEVKATRTGNARLTSTQANMAAAKPGSYVLCVVDLREQPENAQSFEWTAALVRPLARMVSDIGGRVRETCQFVEAARSSPVGIRNETALRYEVPAAAWMSGVSIVDWVKSVVRDAR